MLKSGTLERYLDALLKGDRKLCRAVVEEVLQSGIPANSVYADVIWPIMVELEKLQRSDTITPAQEHLAARINRTIVDQLQNKLPRRAARNKRIVICCSEQELQELGAQMTADLFESDGWEVKFIGGGLNNEDILSFIHDYAPDMLLIYGTTPSQAPQIRQLIDSIRQINAWPQMRIMVSGGLFNRADELWIEIGADLFAATGHQAVEIASSMTPPAEEPEKMIKRRRKVRKSPINAVETTAEQLVSAANCC